MSDNEAVVTEKTELVEFDGVVKLMGPYTDEDGRTYDRLLVEEMSGKDEKLLTKRNIPIRDRFLQILTNTVMEVCPSTESRIKGALPISDKGAIKYVIQRLCVGDLPWILSQIRRLGPAGDSYDFEVGKCSLNDCSTINTYKVDLSQLSKRDVEFVDQYEVVLPRSKRTVVLKQMRTSQEQAMEELSVAIDDQMSAMLFIRIVSVDGKPPVLDVIQNLKTTDREALRVAITKHEPSLELAGKQVKCAVCGTWNEFDINLLTPSFFFPLSR
jgi:hypothetical protein